VLADGAALYEILQPVRMLFSLNLSISCHHMFKICFSRVHFQQRLLGIQASSGCAVCMSRGAMICLQLLMTVAINSTLFAKKQSFTVPALVDWQELAHLLLLI